MDRHLAQIGSTAAYDKTAAGHKKVSKFIEFCRDFCADETGATMVEYAIMGGLAASLMVLAVLGISDLLADAWSFLAATLLGETPFST